MPKEYEGPERRSHSCSFPNCGAGTEDAANAAVKKTFAILGVDIDDPAEVETFRSSLRFADTLNKIASKSSIAFIVALITVITTAICASVWNSLKNGVGH